MKNTLLSSTLKTEFLRLHRNKLLYLCPILILIMSFVSNPIRLGYIPLGITGAHFLANDLVMSSVFTVPFLVVSLFLNEREQSIKDTLYMAPLEGYWLLLGKYIATLIILLTSMLIGIIFYIVTPFLMGGALYNPYPFLIVFLYRTLPALLFYVSLTLMIEVLCSNLLTTLVLPIIYTIFTDFLPKIFWFRVAGREFSPLQYGNPYLRCISERIESNLSAKLVDPNLEDAYLYYSANSN